MTKNGKLKIFLDFDNTITSCDVIDDMLERFSKDKQWLKLEDDWEKGKIGSRQCLEGQTKSIRITKSGLDNYLLQIKLDPSFKKLINFLCLKDAKVVVLSDNFSYILRRILRNNGVSGLKIYSNRIEFEKDKLRPYFPYTDKKCRICAHCKKNNLLAHSGKDSLTVYVGDGLSDICPAQHSDMVFAKGALLKYFKKKKLACIQYRTLEDVYRNLRRSAIWKRKRS